MSDDLRALLAAIVADPADDTARLAYADCLEERGNAPRARFIRLQVEAERLHPDSNARARLEEQAQALFAQHWIEWWGEVCEAVGFPRPVPKPRGRLGSIVRRVPVVNPPGYPYFASQLAIELRRFNFGFDMRVAGLTRATFRRGFPDAVQVYVSQESPHGNFLTRWSAAAPLAALHVAALSPNDTWPDGPHLTGVRSLTVEVYDPTVTIGAFTTPHLGRLEEMSFCVHDSTNEYSRDDLNELNTMFAAGLARVIVSPRIHQLKRLSIPVWSHRAAEVVANAENLAGLESLEVTPWPLVATSFVEESSVTGQRLGMLARSPHLAGLRELKVIGDLDANCIETVIRKPVWTRLRKLQLEGRFNTLEPFANPSDLEDLEELRLLGVEVRSDPNALTSLARSSLLRRVRHFAMTGTHHQEGPLLASLVDAVDDKRIETFALNMANLPASVTEHLRSRFGDRLRLYG